MLWLISVMDKTITVCARNTLGGGCWVRQGSKICSSHQVWIAKGLMVNSLAGTSSMKRVHTFLYVLIWVSYIYLEKLPCFMCSCKLPCYLASYLAKHISSFTEQASSHGFWLVQDVTDFWHKQWSTNLFQKADCSTADISNLTTHTNKL